MNLFKKKRPQPFNLIESLKEKGFDVEEKTVQVGKRDRRPANIEKVTIMKALLDVIDEEDVDRFFLEMLVLAAKLEYRLLNDPANLLASIERKHKTTPNRYVR